MSRLLDVRTGIASATVARTIGTVITTTATAAGKTKTTEVSRSHAEGPLRRALSPSQVIPDGHVAESPAHDHLEKGNHSEKLKVLPPARRACRGACDRRRRRHRLGGRVQRRSAARDQR